MQCIDCEIASSHLFPNNRQINYQKREREREREKRKEIDGEKLGKNGSVRTFLISLEKWISSIVADLNQSSLEQDGIFFPSSNVITNTILQNLYVIVRRFISLFVPLPPFSTLSFSLFFCHKIFPKTRRIYAWIKTRWITVSESWKFRLKTASLEGKFDISLNRSRPLFRQNNSWCKRSEFRFAASSIIFSSVPTVERVYRMEPKEEEAERERERFTISVK